MNIILKNFTRYLDNDNLPYQFLPDNDNMLVIKQTLEKNSSVLLTILIGCDDNETNRVRIYAAGIGEVNSITIEVLQLINMFNMQYSFFKFYVDDKNGRISMQTDIWVENINGNKSLLSLILGALEIADNCYPQIMRLLWG